MKWIQAGMIGLFALAGAALAYTFLGSGERTAPPPVQVETGDYSSFADERGARVVLYTLASCPVCAVAKESLDASDVDYVERSLDLRPSLREDLRSLGAKSVPVMIAGRHKVEGFDEQVYLATLEAERLIPSGTR